MNCAPIVSCSPQHTCMVVECRRNVFKIAISVSQNSDDGRGRLIEAGVVPILVRLLADSSAMNAKGACNILDALVHTGTYRQKLIDGKVKDALGQITR
jgi:hypothetical protein